MRTPADPPLPLARLFAMAYRTLVDELHEALQEQGWTDVRPAFGFVLLAVRQGPVTVTDLASLMGTTKQAASKLVEAMVAAGYVERTEHGADARRRPLLLSARGQELLEAVELIYVELERRWMDVLGEARVERLRRDLVRVLLAHHDGELPPVRPTW